MIELVELVDLVDHENALQNQQLNLTPFAELAAVIRAYNIDENTKYIDQQIANIKAKKDKGTTPTRRL